MINIIIKSKSLDPLVLINTRSNILFRVIDLILFALKENHTQCKTEGIQGQL